MAAAQTDKAEGGEVGGREKKGRKEGERRCHCKGAPREQMAHPGTDQGSAQPRTCAWLEEADE